MIYINRNFWLTISSVVFTIIFVSCGKEDSSPNECSEIVDYTYESDVDFVELLGGEKFTFRKVGSSDIKEFNYTPEKTITQDTSIVTFCTNVKYDLSTSLVFESNEGDYIKATVHQSFNSDPYHLEEWDYSISLEASIDGFDILENYGLMELRKDLYSNENDEFILAYIDNNRFIAFDDFNGNQWLASEFSPSIFFCDMSYYNYKETNSYKLWNTLQENLPEFKAKNDTIFLKPFTQSPSKYERLASNTSDSCVEESLNIFRVASLSQTITYPDGNKINYHSHPYGVDYDKQAYSFSEINIMHDTTKLHQYYLDDPSVEINKEQYKPNLYTFHNNLVLNGRDYVDVYEYGQGEKLMYFSWDIGAIAFTDRNGVLLYREL